MLQREKGPAKTYGFLVAIEIQDNVVIQDVAFKLVDAVSWYEGCGKCEVECMGPLDIYPEPPTVVENEKDVKS